MSSLLEALAVVLLAAWLLGMAFLFDGEPDLWDKLHAQAMEQCK